MHPEYNFAPQYVTIKGNRLHYIDEGEGPVIVMVHGNPTWSFYFRRLIQLLMPRFRVIAIDHIGCGLSDKPQNYHYCLKNHIENLTYLLNTLHVKKFSLVVHDWGGAIGLGYAVQRIQDIEKIVILNTAAFRSKMIPFRIRICGWPIIGEMLVRGANGFAGPATFMAVSKPLPKSIKKSYLSPYNSWKNRIAIHRFVKDIPLTSDHPSYSILVDIEKGLESINKENIPTLILWGGKDFCFNTHFYDRWLTFFPKAQAHYFEKSGHYILEDSYDEIKPLIDVFFTNDDIQGR